jgi:hypothetical protein
MTTYTIESEHGDQIATGIQSEESAARAAQQTADQTGRTVYWGEGGEMHEVRPSTWTLRISDGMSSDAGGTRIIDVDSLDEARAAWIEWTREGDYGDVEDGLPREHTVHGTVTSPLGEVHDVSVPMTRGPRYSIRVYDGDPGSSGCDVWPTHDGTRLNAETLDEARDEALDILSCEAAGLSRDDGYTVGQRIYAMIDDADDSGSDCVSYELTVDDLGEEDAEGDRVLRSWLEDREASR